ncbi:unannotated protein [freshwater metagenome]|uniref:Unannotated protein n=1 Tax=freshwater metagenome TaxID=449393 RepID=A0A6J6MHI9_9ZZZZ
MSLRFNKVSTRESRILSNSISFPAIDSRDRRAVKRRVKAFSSSLFNILLALAAPARKSSIESKREISFSKVNNSPVTGRIFNEISTNSFKSAIS